MSLVNALREAVGEEAAPAELLAQRRVSADQQRRVVLVHHDLRGAQRAGHPAPVPTSTED